MRITFPLKAHANTIYPVYINRKEKPIISKNFGGCLHYEKVLSPFRIKNYFIENSAGPI